jgi:predicted dienelactone hydrolase
MVDSKKRHRSEAEEWLYRLAKDPKQYKKRYIDSIKEMKFLIDELEKIGEETPVTDHFLHTEIVKARKQLNETLKNSREV